MEFSGKADWWQALPRCGTDQADRGNEEAKKTEAAHKHLEP